MNDTTVHPAAPEATTGTRPSLLKVVRDQRKTLWVALAMMVAALWLGQLDRWTLAGCVAVRRLPRAVQPPRHRVLAAEADQLG